MNKVKFNFNSVRDKVMNEEIEDIPVVVTYYPSLNRLNKIIIGKLYLLHINKKVIPNKTSGTFQLSCAS